ncbi:site-specific recombinase [Paraburkholderia bannensis]|uniref:Site-specific recombinase n=1 Tax=Paraburkholderia bannensis TaxID=765414 RepID=A0A7W9TYV5_9BURK|nr:MULTISPECIES: site-specific recombinase [Paraburkholderia]MBB3257862.1 site-specific recombinase [Paraburkholderia sp. WP4_3_2]MBB6102875.1 site-specific recombinase [Paraburkholderia bannensis]
MFRSIPTLWKKWRASRSAGQQLDALLASADADAPYAERSDWLIELAHWIHRRGKLDADAASEPTPDAPQRTPPEHVRVRYLLHVLDRNPAWKANVGAMVRKLLRDSDSISLLCDAGMPVHSGLLGALVERVQAQLIPPAPNRRDLAALVTLMFPAAHDPEWIATLPADLLKRLQALIAEPAPAPAIAENVGSAEAAQNAQTAQATPAARLPGDFSLDLLTALHNLTCQISSTGLSPTVRSRLSSDDARVAVEKLPFFRLTRALLAVENARDAGEPARLLQEVSWLRLLLDDCRKATDDVFAHLYRHGVRVDTVFQVERMRMRIVRAERLLDAWMAADDAPTQARLVADLISANQRSQSVSHLVRSNFALLSRKVVELSADTGEHYIARDRAEYLTMLRMAAGGGLVTAVTVYVKFGVTGAHLPSMIEGLFAGINYAASFLVMHFCHFSLATKQPAMTAPTLARELDGTNVAAGRARFVSSVVALIRTQAAAVLGNVLLVFPACLAIQLACGWLFHVNLISPAKAHATLQSFSLLGPTPLYAALTGVLLWASSLFAGWADNWFVLHRVEDALAWNRRLRMTLGASGAARLARFCRVNAAGVWGNLALGMLLGLGPAIVSAVAFHFEVRHVTLSAGSIGVALGVLGTRTLGSGELWWAVAGVASMAVLNVTVSFALALHMALRSRDLGRRDVRPLMRAFWRRVRRHPMSLVWPIRRGELREDNE